MTVLFCDDTINTVTPKVMSHDEMQRYLEDICTRIAKLKRGPAGNGGEIVRLEQLKETVARAMGQRREQ